MTIHFSSVVHFSGPFIAAILLAGCASDNDAQYATLRTNMAQPCAYQQFQHRRQQAPSLMMVRTDTDAPCNNSFAGEMALHVVGGQAFVPLTVNNASLSLLVDTGDFVTALTPEASGRLALPAADRPSLSMTGVGGGYDAPVVEAAETRYLSHTITHLPFAVLPAGEFSADDHADGLFGANFMSAYGVELDFAAGQMRFYKPVAGCGISAPAWTSHATRLAATNAGHELLLIPIRVNGVELNALLDTGSEDTSITRSAAARLGVTDASTSGDEDVTEQGLGTSSARLHHFDSITIGSTTFSKPILAVDDGTSPLQSPTMLATLDALPIAHRGVDVILGANFLFKQRIFLDYTEHAVFIE